MTRPIRFVILAALTLHAFGSPASAWWEKGHQIIAANAVDALPGDMPKFFKDNAAALTRLSSQPDMWKEFGPEIRRAESPEHYLDLEKVTDDPMKLGWYPDRYGAIKAMFGMNEAPVGVGLLNYRLVEDVERLRGAFAQYRRDPTNLAIQQEIIVYAGTLSHYAGDTSQPLHMTIHFDGRVDRQGNVTKGKGIHERFEGAFVDTFIQQADCRKYVGVPTAYPNLYDAIRHAFAQSFAKIDEVYKLDETGKLTTPDDSTKLFVQKCLAHGSQFLASLWYTAWKESEQVKLPR